MLDDVDGLEESLVAGGELAAGAGLVDLIDRAGEKGEDDGAEELELFEDFVLVESLGVAEFAEGHRFGDDVAVAGDGGGGAFEVVGDAADQDRHVVEQPLVGEHPMRVERDAFADPIKPPSGEISAGVAQSSGEDDCQRAIFGPIEMTDHGAYHDGSRKAKAVPFSSTLKLWGAWPTQSRTGGVQARKKRQQFESQP